MKKLTVITTKKDLSLSFFFTPKIRNGWVVQSLFYEELLLTYKCPTIDSDYIYLRDPFNSGIPPETLRPILESCLRNNPSVKFIDNLARVDDIYLEDKWFQYLVFSEFMPETRLLPDASPPTTGQYVLYKKRISSRAKGILFVHPEKRPEEYIKQERFDIREEYRVLEVTHHILDTILVKSSKTESQEVKVQRSMPLPDDLRTLVLQIQKKHTFDLVGYDIARTQEGALFLIEVNRSPQISAYVREIGQNPFEQLLESL